ncbi:MAG: hypothetical protein JJU46_00380 [Balneolaceae bacterium]|nr:hypothetical protein [Balneolaceae bacterium]MCH8549903.1 hypothetical protein [Balneolaceae bacterium]
MYLRITLIFLFSLLLVACGNDGDRQLIDEDLSLGEQVEILIQADEYETALSILEDEDREDPEVRQLLEMTHLNYGLNSMSTFDANEMRTRMNFALVQFAEVLELNPNNSMAQEQIEQILSIYDTIPDRGPEEETLERLREVGIDY